MGATPTSVSDFFSNTKGGSGQLFNPQSSSSSPLPNFDFAAPSSGQTSPGVVPAANTPAVSGWGPQPTSPTDAISTMFGQPKPGQGPGGINPYINFGKGGYGIQSTLDPQLTSTLMNWLQGWMGKGATPFDLSALLPSGGTTEAGQMTAPLNPLMQQLMKFFQTGQGGGMPGADSLSEMAKTGDPISALPEWQAMVDAQQRQIKQNAANLKEQFGFAGNLSSTPMGNAMGDFYSQTSKDQNALLAQLQQAAMEAAQGRKLGASEYLSGAEQGFGAGLQGLDQQAITNLYNEFIRTRPEYSPLLGMTQNMASIFPPIINPNVGMGAGGAAASNMGGIMSSIGPLMKALGLGL